MALKARVRVPEDLIKTHTYRISRRANSLMFYHVNIERHAFLGAHIAKLWNWLQFSCFPAEYDLRTFKRRVNEFLKSELSGFLVMEFSSIFNNTTNQ